MYKVMAQVIFSPYDSIEVEYSGIEHTTKEAAEEELEKAKQDKRNKVDILSTYIINTED